MVEEELCGSGSQICPYCGHEETYQGDPMGDGDTTETECASCDKEYEIKCEISVDHVCRLKEEDNQECESNNCNNTEDLYETKDGEILCEECFIEYEEKELED